LKFDAIGVGLLCLALLPWLTPLIKSVEIPGVGKIEMQEIKEKAEEARGAAESATQKAELALTTVGSAPQSAVVRLEKPAETTSELEKYAQEYNRLRKTMLPGPSRTQLMTQVVSNIIRTAPRLEDNELANMLKDTDRGKRLAAYSILYAHPKPALLDPLITSVADLEDKPFGQYWGILAIQRLTASAQGKLTSPNIAKLEKLLTRLKPGTDRYFELKTLLTQVRKQ
jgi:hypothetical protein